MPIRDFRDLKVWSKSVDLAVDLYAITDHFPATERFGLTAQLRNAAVSVSSNIAEGNGRGSRKDYRRFVRFAKGSLNEVRSLLHVSARLGFLARETESLELAIEEISKMLTGLSKKLSKGIKSRRRKSR